jgi:hypothetical protein
MEMRKLKEHPPPPSLTTISTSGWSSSNRTSASVFVSPRVLLPTVFCHVSSVLWNYVIDRCNAVGTDSPFPTIIGENCERILFSKFWNLHWSWQVQICLWHDFAAFVIMIVVCFVAGKHTVYRMSAATPEEKDEWIKCVRWVHVRLLGHRLALGFPVLQCRRSCTLSLKVTDMCRICTV